MPNAACSGFDGKRRNGFMRSSSLTFGLHPRNFQLLQMLAAASAP
jgi:hypothetical protein